MEHEQVARLQQHGPPRHVVIRDLDVAELRVRAAVGLDRVHRLALRAGQHPERSVLERRLGHREPHAHLRSAVERKVVGILVPGLPERAGVLEDELRQEAVEIGTEDSRDDLEQARLARERAEHGLVRWMRKSFEVRSAALPGASRSAGSAMRNACATSLPDSARAHSSDTRSSMALHTGARRSAAG